MLSLSDENVHRQRAGFCTLAICVLTHGRCGVLVSVWTGRPPLHPFSVFVGSRAWGIFHAHFSFLSFCGLFHGTQMKERRVSVRAQAHTHTWAHPQGASIRKLPSSVCSPPFLYCPKSGPSGSLLRGGRCRWWQGEGPSPSSSRHRQRDRRRWAPGTVLRGLTACPLENWGQTDRTRDWKQERHGRGRRGGGGEQKQAREKRQSKEG